MTGSGLERHFRQAGSRSGKIRADFDDGEDELLALTLYHHPLRATSGF
jgi:hypothetical protein